MNPIPIAITDDDFLIVELLKSHFDRQGQIDVILTANSGEELIALLEKQDQLPQVLLLDLKMKEMDGVEVTNILKVNYPSISVIVMSSHYKLSFMGFMLKSGVSAFIPKGISPDKLLSIVVEVAEKGFFFLPEQLTILRNQISSKSPQPVLHEKNTLSEREVEILKLICQQKTSKEIAEVLFIAARTVDGHKNNLFAKTGAKNVAGLVIYAIQQQLVDTSEIPII
ncbi:MAG: response regulator transcription factor [Crocinitomicaceae bacterium]|nr:response regulator transcription factor [Crocinitomicaceae bacterium]